MGLRWLALAAANGWCVVQVEAGRHRWLRLFSAESSADVHFDSQFDLPSSAKAHATLQSVESDYGALYAAMLKESLEESDDDARFGSIPEQSRQLLQAFALYFRIPAPQVALLEVIVLCRGLKVVTTRIGLHALIAERDCLLSLVSLSVCWHRQFPIAVQWERA
jgi:hypothetical protein